MKKDVADWGHQPKFWCRFAVGWKAWWIRFGYDRRTKAGKIYGMVDKGTATHIGRSSYPIVPKIKKALRFIVPTPVKTTPGIAGIGPGLVRMQGAVARGAVIVKKVKAHPGIRPREFTESLRAFLNSRTRPGGLRSTTDAAVKRGFRKISKGAIA